MFRKNWSCVDKVCEARSEEVPLREDRHVTTGLAGTPSGFSKTFDLTSDNRQPSNEDRDSMTVKRNRVVSNIPVVSSVRSNLRYNVPEPISTPVFEIFTQPNASVTILAPDHYYMINVTQCSLCFFVFLFNMADRTYVSRRPSSRVKTFRNFSNNCKILRFACNTSRCVLLMRLGSTL